MDLPPGVSTWARPSTTPWWPPAPRRWWAKPASSRSRRTVEGAWIALRRRLADIRSRFTGPLLQVENGQPRMALSGDVQLLELALEGFLGEEFMGEGDGLEVRPFVAGQRILWDVALLESAARPLRALPALPRARAWRPSRPTCG